MSAAALAAEPDATDAGSSLDDARQAVVEIKPSPRWRALDLGELWRYRELAYFLTWRDVKVRYKQTVLGFLWAILQPVMTMLVFTIFFGRLGGLSETTSVPYPIFVYAALLPWQFFQTAVGQSGQSLVGSSNLISKVYFPRLIVPAAATGAALVDLFISFGVMAVLMVWYGYAPSAAILLLPLLVAATLVAALGVGTLLAGLTVAYRDFRYVVPFALQMWMLASPVAYSLDEIPEQWQRLYGLNPLAGLIGGFRSVLLGEPLNGGVLAVSLATTAVALAVGTYYFRSVERRFADIV